MGVNARLLCIKCNQHEEIGRAYHYNEEYMNQVLPKDSYAKLKVAIARFEMTLQKIEIFGDEYDSQIFNDMLYFLEEHKDHEIWLINDYYEESKEEGAE